MWGRPDSNRGPERPRHSETDQNSQKSLNLSDFKDFCIVDLQLDRSTAELHARLIKHFLTKIKKPARAVTKEDLRQYLKSIKESTGLWTYKNTLSSLKRFYRDFLCTENLVDAFKFPRPPFKPKMRARRQHLRRRHR